ncbi:MULTISPECIES: hypothetical protein [Streptomyces]|uniref:Tripartite tricarboxylate transporter TctB family protein n=1 Tax=Streptomyces fradiae ATCC 10745 = DSM 40063 TaxID=1319510 RepID=A0ABQ6XUW4_STRFR|nr:MULTISPECIES: hypothetical protein [Streptomyces]KAF0649190.1 hypothetical protein K701_13860 [Streptomyces fradiae ATCC 10745 = DSM 40063]QEV12034.1 hypothetical protein CP974_08390 [Streptomyces fradiae ATCC 10745 = DSM 40063]
MYEHAQYVQMAAETFSVGGRLLGSVGAGAIATALTVAMFAGIKEPKAAEGKKAGKQRRKLNSTEASAMGLIAGTFYITAGSIWTVGKEVSNGFASIFTSGAFGHAGLGGVALILSAYLFYRAPRPGWAAFLGILAAGIFSAAGGIWGLPEFLLLLLAQKLGLL